MDPFWRRSSDLFRYAIEATIIRIIYLYDIVLYKPVEFLFLKLGWIRFFLLVCSGMELAKLELKAFTAALLKRNVHIEPTGPVAVSLSPIYRPDAFAAKIYVK